MEQTKRREDTADTSPADRRKADRFIKLFYVAGIAVFAAVIYQIIFANSPWYVYALEIAFLTTVIYHRGRRLQCFYRWRHKHMCTADLLGLDWRDYCQKVFLSKEHKNYFEAKLLRKEGFDFKQTRAESQLLHGRTLSEARELEEEAETHRLIVMSACRTSDQIELVKEDTEYIRARMIEKDYEAANQKIDEVIERTRHQQAEKERVLDKAREANCLNAILEHFKEKEFDPEEAELLVRAAQQLQQEADRHGARPVVVAALKNGSFKRAKQAVIKVKDERRKAKLKQGVMSRLRKRIDQLEGEKQHLYRKLENLAKLEYGSRPFNMAERDLEDQILRIEINQQAQQR